LPCPALPPCQAQERFAASSSGQALTTARSDAGHEPGRSSGAVRGSVGRARGGERARPREGGRSPTDLDPPFGGSTPPPYPPKLFGFF
jgi:hypothetical protein